MAFSKQLDSFINNLENLLKRNQFFFTIMKLYEIFCCLNYLNKFCKKEFYLIQRKFLGEGIYYRLA